HARLATQRQVTGATRSAGVSIAHIAAAALCCAISAAKRIARGGFAAFGAITVLEVWLAAAGPRAAGAVLAAVVAATAAATGRSERSFTTVLRRSIAVIRGRRAAPQAAFTQLTTHPLRP